MSNNNQPPVHGIAAYHTYDGYQKALDEAKEQGDKKQSRELALLKSHNGDPKPRDERGSIGFGGSRGSRGSRGSLGASVNGGNDGVKKPAQKMGGKKGKTAKKGKAAKKAVAPEDNDEEGEEQKGGVTGAGEVEQTEQRGEDMEIGQPEKLDHVTLEEAGAGEGDKPVQKGGGLQVDQRHQAGHTAAKEGGAIVDEGQQAAQEGDDTQVDLSYQAGHAIEAEEQAGEEMQVDPDPTDRSAQQQTPPAQARPRRVWNSSLQAFVDGSPSPSAFPARPYPPPGVNQEIWYPEGKKVAAQADQIFPAKAKDQQQQSLPSRYKDTRDEYTNMQDEEGNTGQSQDTIQPANNVAQQTARTTPDRSAPSNFGVQDGVNGENNQDAEEDHQSTTQKNDWKAKKTGQDHPERGDNRGSPASDFGHVK